MTTNAHHCVFPPQVSIPLWALVHLPVVVTITTAVFTPKGWLHCILYVLFENAMGIVKLWAVIAGAPTCLSSDAAHAERKSMQALFLPAEHRMRCVVPGH